ncbi:MAG: peptidoglycan DD-metalloendopeptidase family protein [Porticoccaceae bacterium]|jgi:murein hydrolase activator|nr:peptidoglycan DD-metalloendopeptidase family protein [Porticoccaceae bacterium]MDG1310673.1 peptidoglycan DD-metalloendopeptidase family protein [Porticoccaceae bacterium]
MTSAAAKKDWLSLLCSLLICSLLLGLSSTVVAGEKQEQQLDNLKRSISNLEKKLEDRGKERNSLQSELKKVELEASKINSNVRRLRNKINMLEAQLKKLSSQERDLQLGIRGQSTAIVEQIAAAYKLGNQEPIKLLLNQEDPQQIARVFRYYDYFLQARTEKIQRYKQDVDKLAAVIADIESQKWRLTQSRAELESDKTKLARQVKKRKKTLDNVKVSLRTDKKKLSKLQKERGKLEELLAAVKQAAADLSLPSNYESFVSRKSKLKWPLKGRVAHSFGNRRSGELLWEGWLISAKAGDAVKAVHHGRVVFSNYLRGFGLLVIVDHSDGYMTLYAHNQELLKDTGDWVQSNEILSRAGDTGGLSKPALYFEIRKDGNPADPKSWLGKR